MEKATASVLLLAVIGYQLQEVTGQQCSATGINGIAGCQCNFIEACDTVGNPSSYWTRCLPAGVDQFGLVVGRQRNLAYLCENGAVAILYDCNSRIPLYAATVMDGTQLLAANSGGRPTNYFRQSGRQNQLDRNFQQTDGDYEGSSKRELCYSSQANSNNYELDDDWMDAVTRPPKRFRANDSPCPRGDPRIEAEINRGHLIASQYGRGKQARMRATFTYTNVVPQFGVFNQKSWQTFEKRLIAWGKQNCAQVKGATNVQLFIVVGAIPSTVFGSQQERYFGKKGFSDYKDNADYRVNVPKYMWTAACCKYDIKGTLKYHSTAFYRENNPGNAPCNRADIGALSRWLSRCVRGKISFNLFPKTPQCSNQKNFVPLP